ncbi:hypothetical protein [Actinomadura violacea]|uniref:Uncharacterized protein n=1 Tax=Actinomadura violacea TaxID=2819934 RepID=A0ABS3S8R8_9ACTN|nr:hypothetical protein [Actinomadura violacea]MBO2464963.1 hypothetical protein [Actinomadura violacea]
MTASTHRMRYDAITYSTADRTREHSTEHGTEHVAEHVAEVERVESLPYRAARQRVLDAAAAGELVLARTRTEHTDAYGRRLRFVLSVQDGQYQERWTPQPCAYCTARREIESEGVSAGSRSPTHSYEWNALHARQMLLREPLWRILPAAGMWEVHLSPLAIYQVTANDPAGARLEVRARLTSEARTGRCPGCRAADRASEGTPEK